LATTKKPIEVILDKTDPKKGSVKFYTDERPVALTNVYLSKADYVKLGSPTALKVTIEAHNAG